MYLSRMPTDHGCFLLTLENKTIGLQYQESLESYVIALGCLYGESIPILQSAVTTTWFNLNEGVKMPFHPAAMPTTPTVAIHILEAISFITYIIYATDSSLPPYIFAVDRGIASWPIIYGEISQIVGNGSTSMSTKSEVPILISFRYNIFIVEFICSFGPIDSKGITMEPIN